MSYVKVVERPSNYIKVFHDFVKELRISSKEDTAFDERGTPLRLWKSQYIALEFIAKGLDDGIHNFYILKSRQLGITTITLAIDLYFAAMHPGLNGCIVTENEKNRDRNREIIKKYVASFPDGYFGDYFTITTNNRQVIRFSNGSQFELLVAGVKKKSSSAWAQGSGYTYGHLTECGSYGDVAGLESLEESFAQTNPNRVFIYESTGAGYNHWRDRYQEGQTDPFTKRSTFIGWWAGDTNRIERKEPRFAAFGSFGPTPLEREKIKAVKTLYDHDVTPEQLAWIRWKESNPSADMDMLQQNQPWTAEESFVQTGYSFFQTRQVGKDIQDISNDGIPYLGYRYKLTNSFFDLEVERVLRQEDAHTIELKVWEPPDPRAQYVIGFDPAWGRTDHGDRHAIVVLRCFSDKLVQVAEFATEKIELRQATWILAHIAGSYRDCVVNIELNGPGRVVMTEWAGVMAQMRERAMQPEAQPSLEDAFAAARWYLYHKPDTLGAGYAYNTDSSLRIKQEIMHNFRGHYVTKDLVIRSIPLLKEMLRVVQDGTSIGAPDSASEDCKDDRVFACAYALQAWIDWRRLPLIAQGETYDRVMKREQEGGETSMDERINKIAYGFIARAVQAQGEQDPRPTWLRERGLA